MKNLLKILKPVSYLFFFISIVLLYAGFYYLYQNIGKTGVSERAVDGGITQMFSQKEVSPTPTPTLLISECGEACKQEIARLVSEATATLSGTTKEIVKEVGDSGAKTTYIPMGATFATTSTSWVDVSDSAVYIDVENDYGKDAKVSWEASLKVAHGNGKAFARLYDDTNKIAVDFSQVSTTDNVDFEQVTSTYLPFWRGRNLYKVQLKSLNSFEVTYSGGKIKVSY